jgi:hypothetical protein
MSSWFQGYRMTPEQKERRAKAQAATARHRKKLLEKYDHECQLCGSDEGLQIDHIKPIAKGGSDAIHNLWVLCGRCNVAKGERLACPQCTKSWRSCECDWAALHNLRDLENLYAENCGSVDPNVGCCCPEHDCEGCELCPVCHTEYFTWQLIESKHGVGVMAN